VFCVFTDRAVTCRAPEGFDLEKGELVLSNYEGGTVSDNGFAARPYELRVYRFNSKAGDGHAV